MGEISNLKNISGYEINMYLDKLFWIQLFDNDILFSEPVAGGELEKKRGAKLELQKSSAPEKIENQLQMSNIEPPTSIEQTKEKILFCRSIDL